MLLRSSKSAVAEVKTIEFVLDLSQGGPPRELLFFDRFGISRGENFTELHFGFVGGSDELVRSIVIVVSNQLLKESEQSFVDFISRFGGLPEPEVIPRFRARPHCQVLMADVIGMAHHGAVGEIVFYTLSWKQALDEARQKKNDKPVAKTSFAGLLRCDLQILKKWVLMIYDVNEDKD